MNYTVRLGLEREYWVGRKGYPVIRNMISIGMNPRLGLIRLTTVYDPFYIIEGRITILISLAKREGSLEVNKATTRRFRNSLTSQCISLVNLER